MDLRHALLELAERDKLPSDTTAQLIAFARLGAEPEGAARSFARGVAVLAAALGGLGVIFWIAANWNDFGRAGRFGLLQGFVLIMCLGAALRPAARVPLGIAALLGIGGLFAYFGQTYQTGADPWQLFAWWALLTLPLCAGVRHDALWAAWALVTMSAISLWIYARTGHHWGMESAKVAPHLAGWILALLIAFSFCPRLRPYTGAGDVSMRLALVLAVAIVTTTAFAGLFGRSPSAHFWLGLLLLLLAANTFAIRRFRDTFALSVVGLGLNILLVGLIAQTLFSNSRNVTAALLFTGLAAAGLLAGTVQTILLLSRSNTGAKA